MRLVEIRIAGLVADISKSSQDESVAQLKSLVSSHGTQAEIQVLLQLLKRIPFSDNGKVPAEHQPAVAVLSTFVRPMLPDNRLSAVLCSALEHLERQSPLSKTFVSRVCRTMGLTPIEQVVLAVHCCSSHSQTVIESGEAALRAHLHQLIVSKDIRTVGPLLAPLIFYILQRPRLALLQAFAVTEAELEAFLKVAAQTNPDLAHLIVVDGPVDPSSYSSAPSVDVARLTGPDASLAQVFRELGYAACASPKAAQEVLHNFSPGTITPVAVGNCLAMMVSTVSGLTHSAALHTFNNSQGWKETATTEVQTWHIDNFMRAVKATIPNFNWVSSIYSLDCTVFNITVISGITAMINAYKTIAEHPFPAQAFFRKWKHVSGQASFMAQLVHPDNAHNYTLSVLSELLPRRVNQEGLKTISSPNDSMINAWLLPDVMEVACYLADNGFYERVRRWLEPVLLHFPDVLMIALCTTNPSEPWSALQEDLSQALMPTFLSHHPNWRPVLEKVWAHRPVVVMHGMVAWFKDDSSNKRLTRIFDVAQDIKAISTLLDAGDATFVLELAVLASYRGFLNLEKWLSDQLKKQPRAYAEACIRFLERRFQSQSNGESLPPLQPPMFMTMVNCLEAVQSQVPPNVATSIGVLRTDWMPKLVPNLPPNSGAPAPPPGMGLDGDLPPGLALGEPAVPEPRLADANEPQPIREFSETIDKEANMYFQRIYSGTAAVEDIIRLLKGYKNSDKQAETEVFHCMIRNLFDEYKFFPQYPTKELGITGILFGSLIQDDLVYGRTLSTALRYVLEALKNEPDSKMFEFGVAALKHFLARLKEWPHFCDHIANTPHFQSMPPQVIQICSTSRKRLTLRQQQAAASAPSSAAPQAASATSTPNSAAPALTPAAPEEKMSTPSEDVQDKIGFIFNNLSPSNLQTKVAELRPLLVADHYKWFANYVQLRARREPNFHHLYLDLLKALAAKDLDAAVLASTYGAIRTLISSQSPDTSSTQVDRTILKNLGVFLGLQTLARNKPVLHRDLDLKALVLYAYKHGQMSMMLLVPFVAKVLDTSQYSRIFHAPNPWLMGMLGLFKELHSIPDLKIALKFEVEVLCKSLKLSIDDIPQTSTLPRSDGTSVPSSAVLRNANLGPSPGLSAGSPVFTPSTMNASPNAPPSSLQPAPPMQPPRQAYPQLSAMQPRSMQQYMEVSALSILPLPPNVIKSNLMLCVESAVNEVREPVVERSVKIATISSNALVSKDFCREGDEVKLRQAGLLMIQNLAGNLAMVTAKDPLRTGITRALLGRISQLLQESNQQPHPSLEALVADTANANLDVACAYIELLARERAIGAMEQALNDAVGRRRRYREERTQGPFQDSEAPPPPSMVPERLLPAYGGLDNRQWAVYMNFARSQGDLDEVRKLSATGPASLPPSSVNVGASAAGKPSGSNPMVKASSLDQALKQLAAVCSASVPDMNLARLKAKEVVTVLQQHPSDQQLDLAILVAQRALTPLLDDQGTKTKVFLNALVLLLTDLKTAFPRVAVEVTRIFIRWDSDSKTRNVEAIARLLAHGVLLTRDMDHYLVQRMDAGRDYREVLFAENLLRLLLLPRPSVPISDFAQSIEMLNRIAAHQKPRREQQIALLEAIAQLTQQPQTQAPAPSTGTTPASQAGEPSASTTPLTAGAKPGRTDDPLPPQIMDHLALLELPTDPAGLKDTVYTLYADEWLRQVRDKRGDQAVAQAFIGRLREAVFNSAETTAAFLRMTMEFVVKLAQVPPDGSAQEPHYPIVDDFCQFLLFVFGQFDATSSNLLVIKVLEVLVAVLQQMHDYQTSMFNQRVFHRMLFRLTIELSVDTKNDERLAIIGRTMHFVRPSVAPGFTFSWMELLCSKYFLPAMMRTPKTEATFSTLLVDLLVYLTPLLRAAQLTTATRSLYKATLRLFLVLTHDFGDFVSAYCYMLVDVLPSTAVQLRNIILAASLAPLPEATTSSLSQADKMPKDVANPPVVKCNVARAYRQAPELAKVVDEFLVHPQPSKVPVDLAPHFLFSTQTPEERALVEREGSTCNAALVRSFTTYIFLYELEKRNTRPEGIGNSPAMAMMLRLLPTLPSEALYHVFSAMTNQLRAPSSHTWLFHAVLFHVWQECKSDDIKEHMVRVLLERLVVSRPQPWGLIVTFIELAQNKTYDLWRHPFVRCAPEIEQVFHTIAESCLQPEKPAVA
eukprot:m.274387 g.274387  ORF g.274387 m.274387 type:complete len:2194 (-) comp17686_c0_seq4:641-7222(-)